MAACCNIRKCARFVVLIFLLVVIPQSRRCEAKCSEIKRNYFICESLGDLAGSTLLTGEVVVDNRNGSEYYTGDKIIPVHRTSSNIENLKINNSINTLFINMFKNFNNLRILSINNNPFTTVRTGSFGNLQINFLALSSNRIQTIEPGAFSGLRKLNRLHISNNNLTIVPNQVFNNLTSVHTLNLHKNRINRIEKLAFANMSSLTRLYLDTNNLQEFIAQDVISPNNLANLKRLWLYSNRLKSLNTYMLEGLINLEVLNVAYNLISTIEPGSLSEVSNLTTLVLSGNLITILDGNSITPGTLPKLSKLYLNNNKLMFLTSKFVFRLENLAYITIGGNPWQCACLNLLFRWLHDRGVKLRCDRDYLNGSRPICVVPLNDDERDICRFDYDTELYRLFSNYEELNSPVMDVACVL